jgi:hypothetical protein
VSEPSGVDFPDTLNTTGFIQANGASATGELEAGNTDLEDGFRVELVPGRYQFDLKGNVSGDYGGTLGNPFLSLGEIEGTQMYVVVQDDNGGMGKNARIITNVLTTSPWVLIVSPGMGNQGAYTLVATRLR